MVNKNHLKEIKTLPEWIEVKKAMDKEHLDYISNKEKSGMPLDAIDKHFKARMEKK